MATTIQTQTRQYKQKWMRLVERDPWILQSAPDDIVDDREIVLAAVRRDGRVLQSVSDELKNDKEIVTTAVVQDDGWQLKYASENLKGDREVIFAAVRNAAVFALYHASNELKNDKEIVLAAVQRNCQSITFASKGMKGDKEIALLAVQQEGKLLQEVSDELRSDEEVALAAIKNDGLALQYVSGELQNHYELVLAAVKQNGSSLCYASDELKGCQNIVLAAIQEGEHGAGALQYASPALKNNKRFMLAAIEKHYGAYEYASDNLKYQLNGDIERQNLNNAFNRISGFDDEQKLLEESLGPTASKAQIEEMNITDPDYKIIWDAFCQTCPEGEYFVLAIKRIKHPLRQFQQYLLKKAMNNRDDLIGSNEFWLFHGTKKENVSDIINNGFNRSFANRGAFGSGVYFATQAAYAASENYSTSDENGCKRMFLSRVLTGHYTNGFCGLRTPPKLPFHPDRPYDSLVNNTTDPTIFVSGHNDNQASPEFLIEFSRRILLHNSCYLRSIGTVLHPSGGLPPAQTIYIPVRKR